MLATSGCKVKNKEILALKLFSQVPEFFDLEMEV
jgi:hypothetical protein